MTIKYTDGKPRENLEPSEYKGAWLQTAEGARQRHVKHLHSNDGESTMNIDLTSYLSAAVIPVGAEIARIPLTADGVPSDLSVFTVHKRVKYQKLKGYDLLDNSKELFVFDASTLGLEGIFDGVYDPDGKRIALSGIANARPVLMLYDNLEQVFSENEPLRKEKLSVQPRKIRGLSWVKQEKYYPAMWFGAYLNHQTKMYRSRVGSGDDTTLVRAFRGIWTT